MRVDNAKSRRNVGYTHGMSRVQAYLYLLVALAVVVASFAVYTQRTLYLHSASDAVSNEPIPQPPYTKQVEAQLAASNGFQELVSYTDRGFEPKHISIAKGDTVRFTNNSYRELWVAASANPYPSAQSACGSSAFDSCRALKSGEFWEFTFGVAGTWPYVNNLDKSKGGVVTVQ